MSPSNRSVIRLSKNPGTITLTATPARPQQRPQPLAIRPHHPRPCSPSSRGCRAIPVIRPPRPPPRPAPPAVPPCPPAAAPACASPPAGSPAPARWPAPAPPDCRRGRVPAEIPALATARSTGCAAANARSQPPSGSASATSSAMLCTRGALPPAGRGDLRHPSGCSPDQDQGPGSTTRRRACAAYDRASPAPRPLEAPVKTMFLEGTCIELALREVVRKRVLFLQKKNQKTFTT